MLPVVDLRDLDTDLLRDATHEIGFFYLVGHGVDAGLTSAVLDTARAFFALPQADKDAIAMIHSPHFRGYTRLGGELTEGAVDWREQIDIGPDRPALDAAEPAYLRLQGPNQWPAMLPQLREVVTAWDTALAPVARTLLREWAVSLGAPAELFDAAFLDPATLIKIVRYPPSRDTDQGVGAHKDAGVATLLLVSPESKGLQVELPDGGWIHAPPRPGAFIVNIGELLEVATDGYLRATRHRVVASSDGPDRISVPYFVNPALDARMPHVPLPPRLRDAARGVSDDPNNPLYATYGENAWKSRLRAHADVAAAHSYPTPTPRR